MHQAIAHGTHQRPGDLSVHLLNFIGNLIGRFANDYKIQLNGPERFGISAKDIKIHAARKSLDFGNGFQNILNPFLPISRRHGHTLPSRAHGCAA